MTVEVLAVLGAGLLDPDTPVVAADDEGLTRGDGCFEGLRIHRVDGVASTDHLDRHLDRMARSAAGLGIAFDRPAWAAVAHALAEGWAGTGEAGVKLVLTRGRPGEGPTGYGIVMPLGDAVVANRRDGIGVATLRRGTTASSFADAPWLLGGVKLLSYAVNMAAQREARRRGAQEPLFVTDDGALLEAATSSVVWVTGATIQTVPDGVGNGILHSITTEVLLEGAAAAGWEVRRAPGTVADLRAAQLVALVSSVAGVVEVRAIDGVRLDRRPDVADVLSRLRGWAGFDR